jgi:hypothetical protein
MAGNSATRCCLAIVIFPNETIPIIVPSIFNISLRVNLGLNPNFLSYLLDPGELSFTLVNLNY